MESKLHHKFYLLHLWIGIILTAVCLWDIFVLKVSHWAYYYPYKFVILSAYFGIAVLVKKKLLNPVTGFDVSCTLFYVYSFVGMKFLHPTYIFAFFEGFIFIAIFYAGPVKRYAAITLWGSLLAILSINYLPEPEFMRAGYTIKPHLQIVTLILSVLSIIAYGLYNRQREIIDGMEEKFASIGRQSAFLLHELKSPLARFLAKNTTTGSNDAEYIYSIVEGVELLVNKKQGFLKETFNWEDIETYLRAEFELSCQHHGIQLMITGLEGIGSGHRSTIRLALKNLIKNAIESMAEDSSVEKMIRIQRDGTTIEVSNNGPLIKQESQKKIFVPFFSEKKFSGNLGIGLHFVQSVIKAHNGSIDLNVDQSWNTFRIRLGEIT